MESGSVSRRSVLRYSGVAALAGGLATLAGCTTQRGDGSDGTGTPPTTQPHATDTAAATPSSERWTGPDYGRWLPAPQTVIPASQYQFGRLDLAAFAEHEGKLPPPVKQNVQRWQPMEIDWRTVPMALSFHGNQVISTDYDRTAIVSQITGAEGWRDPTKYEGYTIVQREDTKKAIAVSDAAIIIATQYDDTAAATARGVIDTAQGRTTPYPAASEPIDALLDEFQGGGHIHQWLPVTVFDTSPQPEPRFDGQAGIGKWGTPTDGPGTMVKYIVVYKTPEAVDMAQVRSYVEAHRAQGEPFAPWQNITFRQNGRLAVVEGTVQRGE